MAVFMGFDTTVFVPVIQREPTFLKYFRRNLLNFYYFFHLVTTWYQIIEVHTCKNLFHSFLRTSLYFEIGHILRKDVFWNRVASNTKGDWVNPNTSFVNLNPSRPNSRRREKIKLNFYFHTSSLWCLKRFSEGLKCLYKPFWGTTKECENKYLT